MDSSSYAKDDDSGDVVVLESSRSSRLQPENHKLPFQDGSRNLRVPSGADVVLLDSPKATARAGSMRSLSPDAVPGNEMSSLGEGRQGVPGDDLENDAGVAFQDSPSLSALGASRSGSGSSQRRSTSRDGRGIRSQLPNAAERPPSNPPTGGSGASGAAEGTAAEGARGGGPQSEMSQEEADLLFARAMQEQECAFLLLHQQGHPEGLPDHYGLLALERIGSPGTDEEGPVSAASSRGGSSRRGGRVGVDDGEGEEGELGSRAWEEGERRGRGDGEWKGEGEGSGIHQHQSVVSSDEEFARRLMEQEEREMAARMLAMAGVGARSLNRQRSARQSGRSSGNVLDPPPPGAEQWIRTGRSRSDASEVVARFHRPYTGGASLLGGEGGAGSQEEEGWEEGQIEKEEEEEEEDEEGFEDDEEGDYEDDEDEMDALGGMLDVDNMTYEELSALGEAIGHETKGLPASAVARLPRSTFLAEEHQGSPRKEEVEDGEICTICRCEYEDKDELILLPPCQHSYHSGCISEWLKLNKVCPICKSEVTMKRA